MRIVTVPQVPDISADPTHAPPGLWLDRTGARLVIPGSGSIYLRAYPQRDDEQRVVFLGVVYDEQGRDLDWPIFRSGAFGEVNPRATMATALGFLSAAAASYPAGENTALFSAACVEWACLNSSEVECALLDVEDEPPHAAVRKNSRTR